MTVHFSLHDVLSGMLPAIVELGNVRNEFERLDQRSRVNLLENALHHLRTAETSIRGYLETRPTGLFAREKMDDFVLFIAGAALVNGKAVTQFAKDELERLQQRNA